GAPCGAPGSSRALADCLLSAAEAAADDAVAAEHPDRGFCGDSAGAVEQRIDALLARMTLAEKIAQMHGSALAGGLWRTADNPRHPRWGRAQETYGEDTVHLGRMGAGFVRGAQRHVIASPKHFALNSIENTRFDVDVSVDERSLREIYLPHFRVAVQQAHAGS